MHRSGLDLSNIYTHDYQAIVILHIFQQKTQPWRCNEYGITNGKKEMDYFLNINDYCI